jgi:predicted nucleic acid-binding protein
MIVVDASIALKWAIDEPGRDDALQVLDLDEDLIAPDLIFPELANVLRKKLRSGEVNPDQAVRAIDGVRSALSIIVGTAEICDDALGLAVILDHSAYDCFYLAAAVGAGVLVSADERFLRKCRENGFSLFVSGPREIAGRFRHQVLETSLSRETLEEVERLASLIDATFQDISERLAPNDATLFRVVSTSALTPAFDSPAYRRLAETIRSLPIAHQADLLALGWLGRGHHRREDWPSLLTNARQMLSEGFDKHWPYVVAQLAQVGRGLRKLRDTAGESAP